MTASWAQRRLTAFDLETTSPDPEEARIVQYAVAWVGGEYRASHTQQLVDPGVEIPEEAVRLHGITTEQVRSEGTDPRLALDFIVRAIRQAVEQKRPLVGHNVVYDLTVVDRELRRYVGHGLQDAVGAPVRPVIDTLVLSKQVDRYRRRVSETQGAHVLRTCVEVFVTPLWGVEWDEQQAHGALYDCQMSARVAVAIAARHPQLWDMDPLELHDAQVEWAAEQAASYEEWLRSPRAGDKQVPDAVIPRDWPVCLPQSTVE